jgi:hypothetical protein
MTQKNYSLCLTIIDQNNYSQLLRIADPIGKKGLTLWQLDGKINRPELLEKKNITMDPFSAKDNELAIWEWELDPDDPNKQWSKRTNEIFYELIFLDNNDQNDGLKIPDIDLEDKIDLMISGFKVQKFISDNVLLVFDKSEKKEYICLNLKISDYILENNIIKIKEGTVLDVYKISSEHCIDTNDYLRNIILNNYEVQRRIIYRERKLRRGITGTLRIQGFLNLFKNYFEDIAERMNYTKEQNELIQRTITNSLENQNNIKEFFKLTRSEDDEFIFTQKTVKKYDEASQIINKYASKMGIENFLESVIENTPELKESYIDLLKEDYLVDEKEKIEQELKELERKKNEYIKDAKLFEIKKADIQKEHYKVKKEITEWNSKLENLEERKEQLEKYFEDKILSIKENSGAFLGEIAVLKGITQNQTTSDNSPTIIKSKIIESDEKIIIANAEELIVELEENIYNLLIGSNIDENNLAKYIVGSYLSGLPILLIGNTSELLAKTISTTFCSRTPEIINLPTGYSNYQTVLDSVKSSESDVIFIKNAVGYCDEYIYLNLIKDNPDKFLLFSAEFHDTIKILPSGILGYMGIIDCEEMISPFAFDKILPRKIENISKPKLDKNRYRSLYRKISKLTENSGLTKGYNLSRAKMLSILSDIESEQNDQFEVVIPEIITYNRIIGNIQSYLKYLQSMDNSEYYDTVSKFLSDEE